MRLNAVPPYPHERWSYHRASMRRRLYFERRTHRREELLERHVTRHEKRERRLSCPS